jgi:5-formyltetrahydrofolate cyclo-ligase
VSQKERIRQELKARRLLLSPEEVRRKSLLIVSRAKELLRELNPSSCLFFHPIKNEPDLTSLASELLKEGKTVAFPKVVGREIVPIQVSSLRELQPGRFGILEPPYSPQKVLKEVDAVFVPGIAFDGRGYRIGFGGGYYDRLLEKLPVKAKIGVCFDFQLLEELPTEPFDVPVDFVITENTTVRRKAKWKQS